MTNLNTINTSEYVNSLNFNKLGYKARCAFEYQGKTRKFTALITAVKDTEIYVKILGVGIITIAEARIEPAHILVVNRIQRQVYDQNFEYLKNLVGVDLNFGVFQSLIWAILPDQIIGELTSDDKITKIVSKPATNIIAEYTIDNRRKVWTELSLDIKNEKIQGAHMYLGNYDSVNSQIYLPMSRIIETRGSQGVQKLTINIDRYMLDPKKSKLISFPSSYERMV